MVSLRVSFRDATRNDVPGITALLNAAAGGLTAQFGEGPWSTLVSERGTASAQRHARMRVGHVERRLVSVLRLATKKPWAIDVTYFTAAARPLYLTGMAIAVGRQRHGFGRMALEDARRVAEAWPADVLRLSAYDAPAGAGDFYARCGYRECGRVIYKGSSLIYYERRLRAS
jgi:GNAT superfamily N-acetyltransferase